jgi:hypothetical protein
VAPPSGERERLLVARSRLGGQPLSFEAQSLEILATFEVEPGALGSEESRDEFPTVLDRGSRHGWRHRRRPVRSGEVGVGVHADGCGGCALGVSAAGRMSDDQPHEYHPAQST